MSQKMVEIKGKVVGLNKNLCAVQVSSGITIFEILGSHITEIGDVISGNLESVGCESLYNETKHEKIDASIEDWSCSPVIAMKFLSQ